MAGHEVRVGYLKEDRYGRILGEVYTHAPCPLARDANLEQAQAGMAWWYRTYRTAQSATISSATKRRSRRRALPGGGCGMIRLRWSRGIGGDIVGLAKKVPIYIAMDAATS